MFSDGFLPGSRTRRIFQVLLIGLLSTIVSWSFSNLEFADSLERSTLDLRFRLSPAPAKADSSIVLVLLDGGSMDQLPFPVPRQLYSDVLMILQDWGASAVGFDILFDLPSIYSVTEDSIFGSVASDGRTVFVMSLLQREDGSPVPENAIIDISGDFSDLDSAFSCIPPCRMIAQGVPLLGSSNDRQDPDGVFRNIRLLSVTPDGIAASLPVALAWLALDKPEMSVDNDRFTLGDNSFPIDDGCRLQLRYHGPAGTYRSLPLADLVAALNARATGSPCPVDSSLFNEALVLIGYAAPALYDLKPTPYSARCPGVEVLATALDNLLNGDCLYHIRGWMSVITALLVSLFAALFLSAVKKIPLGASLAVLPPLLLLVVSLLLFRRGIWIDTVWPVSSGVLTILSGGIFLFSSENRRKQEIRTAFSQYLSPDVVDRVTEHPETLVLGGDRRVMTTFFSDIRGFTGISEKLSPEELVSLLNRYLTAMTDIILETGGTVDKFEGDAIMAFWGAPIELDDHAERACSAALQCQNEHIEMNLQLAAEGYPELITRIGLSTGEMVVGNMGSSKRFDYTVMGSTVNLGSRLEGANKVYGTSIMVPEETCIKASDDFVFRELDTIRVVGQKIPVNVFELICAKDDLTDSRKKILECYSEALKLYRAGRFEDAEQRFSMIDDAPSIVMAERCSHLTEEYRNSDKDWDGIFNLSSK